MTQGPPIKKRTEEVRANERAHEIKMGGALDGFNMASYFETCAKHMRQESKFESNVYLKIENVGEENVVTPRVVVKGRRNWFSADDILDSTLSDNMTDAEKAMTMFVFTSSIEVQAHGSDWRVGPPVPSQIDSETGTGPSRRIRHGARSRDALLP